MWFPTSTNIFLHIDTKKLKSFYEPLFAQCIDLYSSSTDDFTKWERIILRIFGNQSGFRWVRNLQFIVQHLTCPNEALEEVIGNHHQTLKLQLIQRQNFCHWRESNPRFLESKEWLFQLTFANQSCNSYFCKCELAHRCRLHNHCQNHISTKLGYICRCHMRIP